MAAPDFAGRLEAARGGSDEAFASLVGPMLLRLSLLIRHRTAAKATLATEVEDLLQEVLFTAWRRLETYETTRGAAGFYPWLAGIAVHVIGTRLQHEGRQKRGGGERERRALQDDQMCGRMCTHWGSFSLS